MSDPIDEAEHFNQDAIRQGVELAAELAERHREHMAASVRRRFAHHPPTKLDVIRAHETARELGAQFAMWLVTNLPWSPERDKALDTVDLAVMHANAAIARYQLQHPTQVDTPDQRG